MLDERRELEIRERLSKGGISEAEELVLREELEGKGLESQNDREEEKSGIRRLVENIPSSAANYAGAVVQPFIHPLETLQGLQTVVSGAAQKIPGVSEGLDFVRDRSPGFMKSQLGTRADIPVAEAVGEHYRNRFGGLRNIKETAIQDPVGLMADVAGVAGLTGLGLRAAGAAKAAGVAERISRATDPLNIAGKAVTSVTRPAYRSLVGQTTGTGSRIVREAMEGSPEFVSAMRGKTTEGQVVERAKDALDDIRQARGAQYRTRLENLKGAKQQIPIDDIKNLADEQLKRFNVKITDDGLDFSRSTASGASAKEIEEVYKLVNDWGSQRGDRTPAMMDILKRRLDDFYAEGRTSRAMVTTLKKAVHNKIAREVPEYAEMTKDYAKATDLIKEMERAIGLGNKTAADTTIRKLILALKEDKSFRSDLLKTLDEAGQSNVTAEIAGASMRPVTSRSLQSLATGGAGLGGLTGLAGLSTISPKLALLLPLASPRLVGELSVVLGRIGKAAPLGRGTGLLSYQIGRIQDQELGEQ